MSTPFEYVYVNQDGTVRELSEMERDYLSEDFSGGDGGRPYIKWAYTDVDGWGSLSGFLARDKVPAGIAVQPVNPDYDSVVEDVITDSFADNKRLGDVITHHPDGTVTCTPNPNLSNAERFEKLRRFQLDRQLERERRARFSDQAKK